jgi:hypothetical protein
MDPSDNDIQAAQPAEHWWDGLSRRAFLRRGTLTAATVGVISTVPGFSGLLAGGASEAPAVETGFAQVEGEAAALSEPLLAHVKDLSTGEISLFQGEKEILIRDPALARRIFSSARP